MKPIVGMCVATAAIALATLATPAEAWWIKSCKYHTSWTGQTKMLADINPGPPDAVNILFGFAHRDQFTVVFQDKLYFQADDGVSGSELWRADGAAVSQVADLVAGSGGSVPHSFAVFQNKLYFAASTPATGEELFSYDGSTVTLAAETVAGTAGAEIRALTEYQGALYFTRYTPADGRRVWRFSGGSAQPVAAINASPGRVDDGDLLKNPLVAFGGKLYYVKVTPLPEMYELWAFDGSTAQEIKALTSGDDLTSYGFHLGVYKGALYFGVVAPSGQFSNKDELWRVPVQGPPVKVATLANAASFTQPSDFQVYQGKLYFGGGFFYRTDGTTVENLSQATGGALPIGAGELSLFSKADRLYLTGFYGDWTSVEPYLFDGATSSLLQNVMPDSADPYAGSFPTTATEVGDSLYFFAKDEDHGRELWRAAGQSIVTFECDIVVAPIWEDKRLWVVADPELVVATWLIEAEAIPRLVSLNVVPVQRGKELRLRVLNRDTSKQPLGEGFGLATVIFDRASGARLDLGFDFIGVPSTRAGEAMRRNAAAVLGKASLKEVMAAPVERY